MDAYLGIIRSLCTSQKRKKKPSFITYRSLYCYKVIPFSIKNVGATYQRFVNKMFADLIGKTIEVYVDDILVKSLKTLDHLKHFDATFQILRRYKMRLNPLK